MQNLLEVVWTEISKLKDIKHFELRWRFLAFSLADWARQKPGQTSLASR